MDSVKFFAEWIAKRLFPISTVIFVLIYIWWFRLTPWDHQDSCCSNSNYKFGIILLAFYVGSGLFWLFIKKFTCLGMFFRLATIFFFVLNSCFVTVFLPRLIDSANYNRTTYYLVSYSTLPDTPYKIYQLTKWHGFFSYEIIDQPDYLTWKGMLFYDKKTNLVNIVAVFDDGSPLLYTDDTPPRYYAHSYEQLGNHLYYISSECSSKNYIAKDKDIYTCDSYTYGLYECELDNSECAMLPFRYTGEENYAFVKLNEETRYIDLYVDDFLAYSYGEHPRCYVDGCEILKSTK